MNLRFCAVARRHSIRESPVIQRHSKQINPRTTGAFDSPALQARLEQAGRVTVIPKNLAVTSEVPFAVFGPEYDESPDENCFSSGLFVGVFSSYAKQLEQGWQILQEVSLSPQTAELQQVPRSLARITDGKLRLMIADYEAGTSAYELAEKYGHNRGTIMKHLAAAGVRSRVAVPTDDEVFRWRELRADGLGFKTIAKRVGRDHKTVRKYLNEAPVHRNEIRC